MDRGGAERMMATGGRDDEERPERLIHRYVQVLTVAQMAVRGLGTLVLLWSTVVLLGGFVTLLKLKDFWFVTMISFSQAARVFSATADEQYLYFLRHWCRPAWRRVTTLLASCSCKEEPQPTSTSQPRPQQPANWASSTSSPYQHCLSIGLKFITTTAYLVTLTPLICVIVLHPVFVVFNIVVSLQRLMQHDYVKGGGDSSIDNLKPALTVFYSLALAQGTLYVLSLQVLEMAKDIPVRQVAKKCKFPWSWGPRYVKLYFDDTKFKCLKDISATRGRNLIAYSSNLLDSDYEEEYLAGARMLVSFIERQELPVKELIRSSRNRIQKLLMMLTWTDEDDQEIRLLAAKIVAHVAGDITIAQFPGTLECVSSLLKPSQDQENGGGGSGSMPNGGQVLQFGPVDKHPECQLIHQGIKILEKLTGDKSNCLEVCKAETLLGDILVAYDFSRSLIMRANDQVDWADISRLFFTVLANLAGLRAATAHAVLQKILGGFETSWISDYASNPELQKVAIDTFFMISRLAFKSLSFRTNDDFVKATLDLFLSCREEAPINPVASPHVQAEAVGENKKVQLVAGEAALALIELYGYGSRASCLINSTVLYQLVEIIHPPNRTVYDQGIRLVAAKMMAHVAVIRIDQFPGMLECVSSLLKPSQEKDGVSSSRANGGHVLQIGQLIQQGLKILKELTDYDDNCTDICKAVETETLLEDILACICMCSKQLIQANEQIDWIDTLRLSFTVLAKLASLDGLADAVHQKILQFWEPSWISDYARNPEILKLAIDTFRTALFNPNTTDDYGKTEGFLQLTLDLFLSCREETEQGTTQAQQAEKKEVRVEAGQAVASLLSFKDSNCTAILGMRNGAVLADLDGIIHWPEPERAVYRAIAAEMLKHLYAFFRNNHQDYYPSTIDRNTHPQQVLGKVIQLICINAERETQGHVDDKRSNNRLKAALLGTAYEIHASPHIAEQDLDQVIADVSYPSGGFVGLLKELIVRSSRDAKYDHLEILTNAVMLFSSVIKRKSVPIQQILDQGIVDSLSEASKIMSSIEFLWNREMTLADRVKNVQDLLNAASQSSV